MTKKTIATTSLVFFLAAIAHARSPISLDILQRDGYGVVPLKHPLPNLLIVHATINQRPVDLVLDTGWSAPGTGIALDQGLARALKVKTQPVPDHGTTWTGAKLGNEVSLGNSILMGNALITGVPLYFGNLAGLRAVESHPEIDTLVPEHTVSARGFITNGFLRATSAIIDLPNLKLYVRPPGTGRRAMLGSALREIGMAEASLTKSTDNHFLVDAEVNGVTAKMAVDTGSTFTMLKRQFASQAKTSWRGTKLDARDAAGIVSSSDVASIRNFKIAGQPAYAPNLTVASAILGPGIDGLLGMDILGQNWSIIDCGQEKLYFAHVR